MEQNQYKHSDLTRQIIGCALKVHNHFGAGFPEAIYKKSLLSELAHTGLNFRCEVEKDIYYQQQWIGKRRPDVLVQHKVLVELKAVGELDKSACNQIINYLNIFEIEVGLLLNFGTDSLQFKRFVYSGRNLRNQ